MKILSASKDNKVLKGTISLVSSKSESNRALIIQALCRDTIFITNISHADDTVLLKQLLGNINNSASTETTVLDTRTAGTVMRFLASYLSAKEGKWLLTGSERMKERPIGILVDALRSLGAKIEYTEKYGFPPLLIEGTNLYGNEIEIDASVSSQYISSLLLIAPSLSEGLTINLKSNIASQPYVEMTLKIMKHFGIDITRNDKSITVKKQDYAAKDFTVESDWSAASYWYEMAAFADDVDLTIKGLKKESLQGDAIIADIFKNFGIETTFLSDGIHLSKGNHIVNEFNYNFSNHPDIAQTVIVCCAGLNIKGCFEGLDSLKIKETDRLTALKNELNKIGITVEINQTLKVASRKTEIRTATIDTYNDHRMAMAFAPLAIILGNINIQNPQVVDKSYPSYWDDLSSVGFRLE